MAKIEFAYAPEKGKCFDVFTVIHRYVRVESGLDPVPFRDETDKRIKEAYERVCITVKENIGQVGFLFELGDGFPTFFTDMFNRYAKESVSISALVTNIRGTSAAEFAAKVLSFFDSGNDYSLNFYKGALENRAMLTEILNNTDLIPDMKWDIVNFIQAPEAGIAALADLIEAVTEEVEAEYDRSAELVKDIYNSIGEKLVAANMDVLNHRNFRYEDLVTSGNVTKVTWAVALFNPVSISFMPDKRSLFVYLGWAFEVTFRQKYDSKTNRAALFKAFAENIRFRLLDALANGEGYASELSRSLSLPMTSLVHHMAILERAGVVTRRTEGKKVYYRINEPMMEVAIDVLIGFCSNRSK